MTTKEELKDAELGMKVFHEKIYDGKECMEVVGIRKNEVELEGDYSGGTNLTIGKEWFPYDGLFRLRKVCEHYENGKSCPLPNVHCSFPDCEPYLTSDHHYEGNIKIDH